MVVDKNKDTKENSSKTEEVVNDEVAAAMAELKAAQEKLDAAKAKLEASKEAPQDISTAPEEVVLEAEPVVQEEASATATEAPNWTPYTHEQPNTQVPPATPQGTGQPQAAYYPPPANASAHVPPQAPPQPHYYYQQPYAQPVATKDHVAAGLLGIFLGSLGIHKFYLGYNTAGFIMLAVAILGSLLTFGIAGAVVWLIGFIEGIMYLVKSQSEFEQMYVFNKREWF